MLHTHIQYCTVTSNMCSLPCCCGMIGDSSQKLADQGTVRRSSTVQLSRHSFPGSIRLQETIPACLLRTQTKIFLGSILRLSCIPENSAEDQICRLNPEINPGCQNGVNAHQPHFEESRGRVMNAMLGAHMPCMLNWNYSIWRYVYCTAQYCVL